MHPEVKKKCDEEKRKNIKLGGELRMEGEQKGKIEKEGNEGGI